MLVLHIVKHSSTFEMFLARIVVCIVVCIDSVFARIINQYVHDTNAIHTNTD